ncbi:36806_t:CDS:2 [Racocetra persica]|uniref:36806_t:CDS:1 n=1 Tax=Racocetra persica TaxID=160502 RepID=A0ACA9LRZ3_9GLOM|nr:36806_t:CDS:2 [Racocetra persica]
MSTKYKSYTVKQKLEIISKAKETSNKAAIVQLQQDSLAVILSTIKLKMKRLFRTRFQQDYSNVLETFEALNSWC